MGQTLYVHRHRLLRGWFTAVIQIPLICNINVQACASFSLMLSGRILISILLDNDRKALHLL